MLGPRWSRLLVLFILVSLAAPILDVSPYQMIYNDVPDVSFLRTIGCISYVHLHKPERSSILNPTAMKGILLGYAESTKGYRVLLSTSPFKIVETMHVTFSENLFNNPSLLLSLPDRAEEHFCRRINLFRIR